jgi:hypothetical protein
LKWRWSVRFLLFFLLFLPLLPEIRLDLALEQNCQGIALPVDGLAGRDTDPALADTVFLDVGLVGAAGVGGEAVGQSHLVVGH